MNYPPDIWTAACRIFDEAASGRTTPQEGLAAAILAERQRCANAVRAEKLIDPTSHSDDIAYDTAIDHAHDAIWRIEP